MVCCPSWRVWRREDRRHLKELGISDVGAGLQRARSSLGPGSGTRQPQLPGIHGRKVSVLDERVLLMFQAMEVFHLPPWGSETRLPPPKEEKKRRWRRRREGRERGVMRVDPACLKMSTMVGTTSGSSAPRLRFSSLRPPTSPSTTRGHSHAVSSTCDQRS